MSDWWTQPSTPARASAFASPARASTSRARFVADDPDPSADAPKFLPSFVGSPAGKLALGTSPASVSSPPAPKRSPTARFSVSMADSASSPHLSRSVRAPATEDDIPTRSLHDEPVRPASAVAQAPDVPPALEPSPDTNTLHVWGPPPEHLPALRAYLEGIGPVVSYVPGPEGSNWWTVTYATPLAASYALRRHGEIVSGRWMLGFKVAGPGSTQGLTLVNGISSAVAPSVGVGIPIQVHTGNIIRAKPKPQAQTDDYAWDESEPQPSGLLGRAAEFIFGR
ncbi:hypothetical protein CcaverHIS002_0405110 [Cutaneotrichosporon cavernicola]|uniref:RRM Nup35-type domain-containing protein n=1 Tax=Cutaneotrichosporon cavernicola TaxID=279322 RepID=A0AA48L4A9_9TREE|nr:uncharacterized protein CcaverHIS019_0405070 [Cutaneotrichosporon cavernicola]BEI83907.1 hypothetical protein CcaverHIS002_0405110 [Cutaneotrichosporon cavernicola]BEI91687.1 hypothetical protein CcaverHIS019_0405070 [Cutaneotrichosporon cavernicola]BEI99462.1 hypothetical protein CcaverHIS631_0405050 [Cutaneotrichosporon cavernicola]BEJ07240.1 hypothetical protein CcaverHIS641_0405090 [Cutaneotrichosporon cavernicola]